MLQSTIKLSKDTQERLREHGRMGDSFEDVVNRLLDESADDEVLEDDEPDAE